MGIANCDCWGTLRDYCRDFGVVGKYDSELLATVLRRGEKRNAADDVEQLKISVSAKWSLHDPCGFHAFYLFAVATEGRDAISIREL